MEKYYNFIIEGKLVEVYEKSFEVAEKIAYEIIEELKKTIE